jgi:hypothetical protein
VEVALALLLFVVTFAPTTWLMMDCRTSAIIGAAIAAAPNLSIPNLGLTACHTCLVLSQVHPTVAPRHRMLHPMKGRTTRQRRQEWIQGPTLLTW